MKPELTRTPMDRSNASSGFTLIELVITMLVTAVMSIAVATNYISQEEASSTVREVAQLQQQLRGAMYIMELDLRITGYDPEGSGSFGVINVQRWSITDENTDPALSVNGSPSLTVAYDWDPGVPANANTNGNGLLEEPTPAYRLFDDNNDGIFDLVRDDGTKPRPILAEGIDAVGYAYAFDADGDGDLDRSPGGFVIWAVDSDNDNFLDTNLDATDDGVIDRNDDTDGDYRITPADGAGLAAPVIRLNIIKQPT